MFIYIFLNFNNSQLKFQLEKLSIWFPVLDFVFDLHSETVKMVLFNFEKKTTESSVETKIQLRIFRSQCATGK